jgi:hypothetical protein
MLAKKIFFKWNIEWSCCSLKAEQICFFNVQNMVSDNCFFEGTFMVLLVLLNLFS